MFQQYFHGLLYSSFRAPDSLPQTAIVCQGTEVQQRPLSPKQHKFLVAREIFFVFPLPSGLFKMKVRKVKLVLHSAKMSLMLKPMCSEKLFF
jgi:hypothetical protein